MKISVVYGGTKEERIPSEKNAGDIAAALDLRGYDTVLIDFGYDIIKKLKDEGTDAVFLCVQGKGYGDGTFQGMLEHEKIPFTGSGMRAASLINDKILCKLVFDKYGIVTPRWNILHKKAYEEGDFSYDAPGFPFVAKAPTQGGSFGIELIKSRDDIALIKNVFEFDDPILLEDFIDGRFYTVGLYESKGSLVTLPVIEGLDLRKDADGKLISFTGNYGTQKPSLDERVSSLMMETAKKVFEITGAKGVARVDFMVDRENIPYVLEINAVPGLKKSSLMPQEAALAGIEYEDMIEDILRAAL